MDLRPGAVSEVRRVLVLRKEVKVGKTERANEQERNSRVTERTCKLQTQIDVSRSGRGTGASAEPNTQADSAKGTQRNDL